MTWLPLLSHGEDLVTEREWSWIPTVPGSQRDKLEILPPLPSKIPKISLAKKCKERCRSSCILMESFANKNFIRVPKAS